MVNQNRRHPFFSPEHSDYSDDLCLTWVFNLLAKLVWQYPEHRWDLDREETITPRGHWALFDHSPWKPADLESIVIRWKPNLEFRWSNMSKNLLSTVLIFTVFDHCLDHLSFLRENIQTRHHSLDERASGFVLVLLENIEIFNREQIIFRLSRWMCWSIYSSRYFKLLQRNISITYDDECK